MKALSIRPLTFSVTAVLLFATACNKPSNEQIVQALKDNPSLLADAIKKDPETFKPALLAAREMLQKSQMKEQQEEAAKEQEKRFADPLKPVLDNKQVFKGPANAKITIVEYTDFECPYCSRGAESMKALMKKYGDKVRVTVKHLPLPFHQQAMPAARYFEAVRLQKPEAALQFHDELFANQGSLKNDGEKFLEATAKKLGMKVDKLKADLKTDAIDAKIKADMDEARNFGFRGTPAFLVNGVPVRGALPPEEFEKIIDRLLKKS